jgi:transcriptional regulator with XRE-family HTH domain
MTQQKTRQKTQEEKEFNARISKRMKVIRETLGLTLEDLGKILNISFQQVGKYELGKSDISFYKLHLFLDYCREHKGRSYTLDEFVSSKEFNIKI